MDNANEQTCPYVVGRTTLHCSLTPFTLTDEEREAIERLCEAANDIISDDRTVGGSHWQEDEAAVAVARGLLERLK